MIKERKLNVNDLREWTSKEIVNDVIKYFMQNPKKTVYKLGKRNRIRKHEHEVNVFYVYMV